MCVNADNVVTPTSPTPLLPVASISISIRLTEAAMNPVFGKIILIQMQIHPLNSETPLCIGINFLCMLVCISAFHECCCRHADEIRFDNL